MRALRIAAALLGGGFFIFLVLLAFPRPVLLVQVGAPTPHFFLEAMYASAKGPLTLFNFVLPRDITLKLSSTGRKNPDSADAGVCVLSLSKKGPYRPPLQLEGHSAEGTWRTQDCDSSKCACSTGTAGNSLVWKLFEEGTISLALWRSPESGVVKEDWNDQSFEQDLYSLQKKSLVSDFSVFDQEGSTFSNLLPLSYSRLKIRPKEGSGKLQKIEVRLQSRILHSQRFSDEDFSSSTIRHIPDLSLFQAVSLSLAEVSSEWWFWCGLIAVAIAAAKFCTLLRHGLGALVCFGTLVYASMYLAVHFYSVGNWDPFNYSALARVALNGGILYRDIWQDKPPLAPLLFLPAALMRMPWGMNLELAAVVFLCSVLAFQLLKRYGFSTLASIIGGASYFWGAFFMFYEGDFLGLEHLSNVLILSALLLGAGTKSARQWFFAGSLMAALVLIRQNNLFFIAWVGCPLLLRENRRLIPSFILGGFAGTVAVILCTLPFIDLSMFWYVLVEYPKAYAKVQADFSLFGFYELILHFLSHLDWVLGVVLLMIFANHRTRKQGLQPKISPVFLFTGFLITFLVIIAPQKYYQHYSIYWLPWVALVAAATVEPFVSYFCGEGRVQRYSFAAMTLLLLAFGAKALLQDSSSFFEQRNYSVVRDIREVIQKNSRSGDSIYVFGGLAKEINQNVIYTASGLSPANPISNYCELAGKFFEALPAQYRDFWQGLENKKPDILIYGFDQYEEWCELSPELRTRVQTLFRANYQPLANINGFIIGRLKPESR